MKNSIKFLTLVLALSISMAGCSKASETASSQTAESSSSSSDTAKDGAKGGENAPAEGGGRPESTTLAENQTQVMGKVTSITGDQLVLALGEMSMPEMPAGDKAASGTTVSGDKAAESKPAETKAGETQASGGQAPADGKKPTGDAPKMDGGKGGQTEITLTGESATYTISADAEITQMGSNEAGDISSIVADVTVSLILEKGNDGTETVVQIQILQG